MERACIIVTWNPVDSVGFSSNPPKICSADHPTPQSASYQISDPRVDTLSRDVSFSHTSAMCTFRVHSLSFFNLTSALFPCEKRNKTQMIHCVPTIGNNNMLLPKIEKKYKKYNKVFLFFFPIRHLLCSAPFSSASEAENHHISIHSPPFPSPSFSHFPNDPCVEKMGRS